MVALVPNHCILLVSEQTFTLENPVRITRRIHNYVNKVARKIQWLG